MIVSDVELLRGMLRIRRTEEALADRYHEQEMRCPMHLCIGQEAIAVGVCAALERTDQVFSNHRAHGHYLAKGGDLRAMIAEIYGRATGCCGGNGGSMHLIDIDAGFMGATPIVGGTVPLAVGAAWSASLQRENRVVTVFFGDGCFEEGVVHESMNFAALHKLPVVFVCENNGFSVYTRLSARQPDRPIFRIAEAHGLRAVSGDGNNVRSVLTMATEAVALARNGAGPQFLELHTYRWREHCGPDYDHQLGYRSPDEIDAGMRDCPITRFVAGEGTGVSVDKDTVAALQAEIDTEIATVFEFALASPVPQFGVARSFLYA